MSISSCQTEPNSVRIVGGKVQMYYLESIEAEIPHLVKYEQPATQLYDWNRDFVIIGISFELEKYYDSTSKGNSICLLNDSLRNINVNWLNNEDLASSKFLEPYLRPFPSEYLTIDNSVLTNQILSHHSEDSGLITPYLYTGMDDFINSYNKRKEQIQNCALDQEFYFYLNTYKIIPEAKVGTISLQMEFNNRTIHIPGVR